MADAQRLTKRDIRAQAGLRLPKITLQRLRESGVFCVPTLSVALQRSTSRYVIWAQESGGAVANLGAYCGVVCCDGTPMSWLQRIDSIVVNRVHARAVATGLVRIQVIRVMHTYDLLITQHTLGTPVNNRKPDLVNTIIYHGRQGTLELDLWGKDAALRGGTSPVFYDRGGDPLKWPDTFDSAVRAAIAGVSCCGCEHTHLLVPPVVAGEDLTSVVGAVSGGTF